MSDLPSGWTATGLLEISELVRGVTYIKVDARDVAFDGSIPVIRANNIQDRTFDLADLVYVPSSAVSSTQRITKGDVVVATSSGSISVVGKAAQASSNMNAGFGAFCGLLRPSSGIDARYFGHYFSSHAYRTTVSAMARGVNINNLKRGHFEALELPLAPLDEQTRIADKLDAVLARVDACRARLDRIPAILKRFRQSVLAAATSGTLTEEWRGNNGEYDWVSSELSACGTVSGGLTKNAKRQSLDLVKRYLRVANVYANRLELSNVAEIGLTGPEYAKTKLQSGDLLIVEGNGSLDQLGRVALWSDELDDCVHQNHLIRWRTLGPLPRFVLYWLLSPRGRSDLMNLASTTTGLHTLSISKVGAVPIDLPSMAEQTEIVRRVEALFAYADRLEARYAATRARVDKLTPATLAKAFRGELVPQDPNDEPASALLARIAAARAGATPTRSPRTKSPARKDPLPS